MKPMVFHILLILMDGESHGYGIVKALEERLPDEHIEPGNLYRTLRTLMADGFIEESDRRPDLTMDDQRRRYFGITDEHDRPGGTGRSRGPSLHAPARYVLRGGLTHSTHLYYSLPRVGHRDHEPPPWRRPRQPSRKPHSP